MKEDFGDKPQEQQTKETTPQTVQVANMDYSDYLTLLMESRIISPS